MKKIASFLLIGCLSMLCAEVFSGASNTWFMELGGWIVVFPIYLIHLLFFLHIALHYKKTSLSSLYLLGILFALYESWITKVLWAGYMTGEGPGFGTFLGLAMPEQPLLTFFWHPIMAFILPILLYQIISGKLLESHNNILTKTRKKEIFIIISTILISTFVSVNNIIDPLLASLSLLGTYGLIWIFHKIGDNQNIGKFHLENNLFKKICRYMAFLYFAGFFMVLGDRIPKDIIPYISIISTYAIVIKLFHISKAKEDNIIETNEKHFSKQDIFKYATIMLISTNLFCLIGSLTQTILAITYLSLAFLGTGIFLYNGYNIIKK